MLKLTLRKSKGWEWYSVGNVHVKGYAFTADDNLLRDTDLCAYFDGVDTKAVFEERIRMLNGSFAIIVEGSQVFAAVDRLRSLPLFYYKAADQLVISDYLDEVPEKNSELNKEASIEFLTTGYVTGKETLLESVWQLPSCSYLSLEGKELVTRTYTSHYAEVDFDLPVGKLTEQLDEVVLRTFRRLVKLGEGKRFVVPLSGGYDSRFILAMLKRLGCENVLCYTYGREGSYEVEMAREVSTQLGYEWELITYSKEKWQQFYTDPVFNTYCSFAGNFSSNPHFQDFIAVQQLVEKGKVDEQTLLVPGHSADLLAGKWLPVEVNEGNGEVLVKQGLVDLIYQTHYVFSDLPVDEQALMRKRIASRVPANSVSSVATLVKRHDQWNINERQAKFTVNSLRLFDFFGIRWAIPLWDNEFTEFWHQVPLKHKKYKALYNQYVMEVCFAPLGIDFKRHENLTEKGTALFIKKVLPYFWAKRLRSFVHFVRTFNKEQHFNAFDEIYLLIYDGLTDEVKSRFNSIKNLNQAVAAHYLQLIKKSQ